MPAAAALDKSLSNVHATRLRVPCRGHVLFVDAIRTRFRWADMPISSAVLGVALCTLRLRQCGAVDQQAALVSCQASASANGTRQFGTCMQAQILGGGSRRSSVLTKAQEHHPTAHDAHADVQI